MTAMEYVNRAFGDTLTAEEKSDVIVFLVANGLTFNAETLERAFKVIKDYNKSHESLQKETVLHGPAKL